MAWDKNKTTEIKNSCVRSTFNVRYALSGKGINSKKTYANREWKKCHKITQIDFACAISLYAESNVFVCFRLKFFGVFYEVHYQHLFPQHTLFV